MIKKLASYYSLRYPESLIYMLQSTEYQILPYLRWFWRVKNFNKVMHRRKLHKTKAARILLLMLRLGAFMQVLAGLVLVWLGYSQYLVCGWQFGLALIISYPLVWAYAITLPLIAGRVVIIAPRNMIYIHQSKKIFKQHPGTKIAVAGSYGKTSMKELLLTVLSEGKKVRATPANRNVASSHAQFARTLNGREEVLIIEYGEGHPGDVAKFARTTTPTMGVITGIAPAHMDHYPTLEVAAKDIFSLADYLKQKNIFVNADSESAQPHIKPEHITYSSHEADGWKISNVKNTIMGTQFTMKKGSQKLVLKSGLLGIHNVGPLAVVAVIAMKLGLSISQIEAGVAKTAPFEHRMQPRKVGSAWVIDDTYNGNIDGMKAGLELLATLPAKRRIYVTPGLVDQGVDTVKVHKELGRAIAVAQPDKTVLMQNSVTKSICVGMEEAGYKGELIIEKDPLRFYTNLDHILANGDLLLMQNDWPDNYN